MLRNILAVVGGYAVMVVFVMLLIMILAVAFPEYREAAEKETTPPALPVALNLIGGFVGSVLGGVVCFAIAQRNRRVVYSFAAIVFVVGIGFAIAGWNGPQPQWYLTALPPVGAIGILLGVVVGSLQKRHKIAV